MKILRDINKTQQDLILLDSNSIPSEILELLEGEWSKKRREGFDILLIPIKNQPCDIVAISRLEFYDSILVRDKYFNKLYESIDKSDDNNIEYCHMTPIG